MKALVLEIRDGYAAVLREDGTVVRTRQDCQVGDTIELGAEILRFPSRRRWIQSAAAAVLALVVVGGSYTYTAAASYVSLDVDSSSIEFSINRLGRVIGVKGLNESGTELAETLSGTVRSRTVDAALDAAVEQLREDGYLAEGVIVGVTADSEERRAKLSESVDRAVAKDGDFPFYLAEASRAQRREAMEQSLSAGQYLFRRSGMNFAPADRGEDAEEKKSAKETQSVKKTENAAGEQFPSAVRPEGGERDSGRRPEMPQGFGAAQDAGSGGGQSRGFAGGQETAWPSPGPRD